MSMNEKAMLTDLDISMFSARRHDKEITAEVARNHSASDDAGRYNKLLISKNALAKPQAAAGALRASHYKFTLPWADSGPRILPVTTYDDYMGKIREDRIAFDAAADEFARNWPDYVRDAMQRLNGMFRQDDYPPEDEIRSRFSVDINFYPLPDASDFRVQLTETELKRIREDAEVTYNLKMERAMREPWQRAHDVVSRMVERLEKYSVDAEGKVSHPFRDSLISNVREVVTLLPKLNITGDSKLASMAGELEFRLCQFDATELRESDTARQNTLAAAQDILKSMVGYV